MTILALARVSLVNPLPDMGDRTIQGLTTIIASDEWMAETDYQSGSIGDVIVYRNTSVTVKDAPPTWEWYAGVPNANIKSYRLAGTLGQPTTLKKPDVPSNGESKAQNPQTRTQASSSAGK